MRFKVDGKPITFIEEEDPGVYVPQKYYDVQDKQEGMLPVKESTELGDSLKELNNDDLEEGTRMSGIDMRSRLHYTEVSSILAVDSLVAFRFLPVSCLSFTRQKKRLAVSLAGKGRDDIVNLVSGKKDVDAKVQGGSTFVDRIKGVFGGNKNE